MYLFISTFCFFVLWKTSMGAPKMGGLLFDPLYHEASTPPTINKKIVPSDYLQTILRDASKNNRTITSKKIVLPPIFLQSLLKSFSSQYTKSSIDTTTSPVVIFLSFLQNPSNNITGNVKVSQNISTTISKTTRQHQSPLMLNNFTKQSKNDIFITKTFKTSSKLKPISTSKPSVNNNNSNKAIERHMQASAKDSNVNGTDNTKYTTTDTADNILILLKKVLEHSATIANAQTSSTNHVKPLIRNSIDHNDTTSMSPNLNGNLKTFINSTSEIKRTSKSNQKHFTTVSPVLLPKNISKVQSTSTPTTKIDVRLRDILAMKLREARRIYVGYEFNDDQCQIINGRIICGYDKNTGKIVDMTAFADAGNNCRYRADRLECGYGNSITDTTTLVNPFFLRRVNTDDVVKNETIISTETTLRDVTIADSTSNATTTTNPASTNSTDPLTEQQAPSIKKTSCVDMVDRIVCYDL